MDILAVLQRLGSGRMMEELHEALLATASEVVATGKQGTVTVSLKVSTRQIGDPLVVVDAVISRSVPKRAPKGAFFWAVDGALHQEDPRQLRMEFRTVDTEGQVRDVNTPENVERSA